MEQKLLEIFKIATQYSQKSKKNYMEVSFDYKQIEIGIREKETYKYLAEMKFYLKNIKIEEIIEKLKSLNKEDENV